MFKENYYKTMPQFKISHPFLEERDYGLHAGIDYVSSLYKKQYIYNLFDGQFVAYDKGRDAGNYIIIRHNPKFINGCDTIFYSRYKHLYLIDSLIKSYKKYDFIPAGIILGNMGNTGYCLTKIPFTKNTWRKLTDKEINNPKEKKGVHLDLSFYQKRGDSYILKKELKSKLKAKEGVDCFFQWNKLFINPDIIIKYFMMLQGRKI